jgi:hypothetical protein
MARPSTGFVMGHSRDDLNDDDPTEGPLRNGDPRTVDGMPGSPVVLRPRGWSYTTSTGTTESTPVRRDDTPVVWLCLTNTNTTSTAYVGGPNVGSSTGAPLVPLASLTFTAQHGSCFLPSDFFVSGAGSALTIAVVVLG